MPTMISPDDVVVGVLHQVDWGDGERVFVADRQRVHTLFYQLKRQFPDVFSSFRFRNKGFFFESSELDQALFDLEASKFLQRHNDTPRCYFVQSPLDDFFTSFVEGQLSEAGIPEERLNLIAEAFSRNLRVPASGVANE